MPILHIKKSTHFTSISNALIQDPTLSLKAKGLLIFLLSKPPQWKFTVNGLAGQASTDGIATIKSALKELRQAGHLTITPRKDHGQIIEWEWTISEVKSMMPEAEIPHVEKPHVDFPHVENLPYINNDPEKTDVEKTEKDLLSDAKPSDVRTYSAPFEQFWKSWPPSPRKNKKTKCALLWKTRGLDPRATELCAKVEQWKRTQMWQDGYEPMPYTWLYGREYDDDIPAADVNGKSKDWLKLNREEQLALLEGRA